MNADREEMLPEGGFSPLVRGRWANCVTPEEREAALRDHAFGMVRSITGYALEQIRELEEALFTLILLSQDEPAPRDLPDLAAVAGERGLVENDIGCRLRTLANERDWLVAPRTEVYTGAGSFSPIRVRLEGIYHEARALKEQVVALVERHLARSGMSEQEIERKTEETARLWQAA